MAGRNSKFKSNMLKSAENAAKNAFKNNENLASSVKGLSKNFKTTSTRKRSQRRRDCTTGGPATPLPH